MILKLKHLKGLVMFIGPNICISNVIVQKKPMTALSYLRLLYDVCKKHNVFWGSFVYLTLYLDRSPLDIGWAGSSKFGWLYIYAEFPCKLHNVQYDCLCQWLYGPWKNISGRFSPHSAFFFQQSNWLWTTFNFPIYHLVEVSFPNLKNSQKQSERCCELLLLPNGSFSFAGTGWRTGLNWLHFFFFLLFEKCFNFCFEIAVWHENPVILHIICNSSHLNWGSNNQCLLTCRGIQLLPSSHERCQPVPKSSFISLKRALVYTIDL